MTTASDAPVPTLCSTAVQALTSMTYEFIAVAVFFTTWLVVSKYMKQSKVDKTKSVHPQKPRKPAQELADNVMYLCQTQFTRALRVYRDMVRRNEDKAIMDENFYMCLCEAAIRVGQRDVAMQIITRMHENGLNASLALQQSLLRLLCARKFFVECLKIRELFEPPADLVMNSCLSLAAAESGDAAMSLYFLEQLGDEHAVESRDYLPYFRLLHRQGAIDVSTAEMRKMMAKGRAIEPVCFNMVLATAVETKPTLIDVLFNEALEFEKRTGHVLVDVVTYNTRLKAAANRKDVAGCFSILNEVNSSGVEADDVTYSTLLDVCVDSDECDMAGKALEQLSESGVKMNCVLLTTVIKGFVRTNQLDKAMQLLEVMQRSSSRVRPDLVTYSVLIKAHCEAGKLPEALQLLEVLVNSGAEVDSIVFAHILEGCAKDGNSALAEKLFNDMLKANIEPTSYALNAMTKVYSRSGEFRKAVALVDSMEVRFGVQPTEPSYSYLIASLFRNQEHGEAWRKYGEVSKRLELKGQLVNTMLTGLCEARRFPEFFEVVRFALDTDLPRLKPETFGFCLNHLLHAGAGTVARQFIGMLKEAKIEVHVPNLEKRLSLL
jgi:pentatricopeptide repeat protein